MKFERLTLVRANMGNYRSKDAMMPLSMAILAARTPKGIDVRFYDDKVETIPEDDYPDLMAITVETFTARRAYQIADRYRARGIPVVMGGYHPTFLSEEALRHADAVVIGDAEGSWERVLDDFQKGRLQQRYVGGNQRPLDDFVLDREIFRGKKYVPVIPVQYGRGCRFACNFCSIRAFYQDDLRTRSPQQLANELSRLQTKRLVFFVDDNLFNSTQSLNALLDAIQPLDIRWSCQISIDVARDERLLDRIAEAGCVFALVGFESLSEANLKQMGKPWNRVAGDYRSVVKRFDRRGISVYGTFVFGYDGDTADTIQDCLDFAMEAKLGIANFNPLTPTPGSPLYDQLARENRLLSPQWWLDQNYRYGDPIFIPKSMSPKEFAQKCFQAKQAFYSWPSIAKRVFRADAGFDWFRSGMLGLANIISRKEILRKQYRVLGE
jgi:radical SAM superfamily enzyme YgiQ (UPF0313 family)